MPKNSSYRESRISVQSKDTYKHSFFDSQPNHIVFSNNSASPLYVSASAAVSATTFDMIIPAFGTKMISRFDPYSQVFIYTESASTISVMLTSFNADFNPSSISQSQEFVAASADGLLGIVDVNHLMSPLPTGTNVLGGVFISDFSKSLPAGTNNIGKVDINSLPALPAGTNNVGKVDINSLPALPAGTNNVGKVDINSLPALPAGTNNIGDVDVLSLPTIPAGTNKIGSVDVASLPINSMGYKKVDATAAGDVSVKATGGLVSKIVVETAGIDVFLKDGANQAWMKGNHDFHTPLKTSTSIILNFSAPGTAWVEYV